MYQVKEKDWKVFRKKIVIWQENYMGKLVVEYQKLLSSNQDASDKFWALEKRIRQDKRKTGVVVDMRRSKMIENICRLLHEEAITMDDLKDFSDEFQEVIQIILNY